jgi:sugar lactone lactonase YvrE
MLMTQTLLFTALLTGTGAVPPPQPQADSEIFVKAGSFHAEIEGPATDQQGNLYAVNVGGPADRHKGTIGKVTPTGEVSLYLRLPTGSVGNGIRFDQQGVMYIADYTGHNIWRYAAGKLSLHSHQSQMHQPNDLAISRSGVLFASDPDWKNNQGQIWRVSQTGDSQLVDTGMGTTNGIEISPDQQKLYVNESAQRRVWVYQLDQNLQAGQKKLLHQFADFGLDGMRCDDAGNLYIARYGKGVIAKLSPDGTLLQEYQLQGKYPTNVSFSPDQQWLYVTMQQQGAVERINLQPLKK